MKSDFCKIDKAYEGFLESRLIWFGDKYGMTQFVLPVETLNLSNLPKIPSNRRLGHQAEFVFLHLLHACAEFDVLAHSIQLIEDKRTLGELDFIIQNVKTEEVLHVELTYKFYILDRSISAPIDQLIGPNRKDTFVKKLRKTRDQQMPLLYSQSGRDIVRGLGLEIEAIKQYVAFYAHVFVPYMDRIFNVDNLNEKCVIGYWVTQQEFQIEEFKSCTYYYPIKSEWMHIPHQDVLWSGYNRIMDDISSQIKEGRSVMLWKKGEGNELIERFFICA